MDLIEFYIRDLYVLLEWVDKMVSHTRREELVRLGVAARLREDELESLQKPVECLKKNAERLELPDVVSASDSLLEEKANLTLGEARGRLLTISRLIKDSLGNRTFLYLPQRNARYGPPTINQIKRSDKEAALTQSGKHRAWDSFTFPFGKTVWDGFPSAREDIRQAGTCMMANCTTASVFHLMRASEQGIRALCVSAGVKRLKKVKNKQTGRYKWVAIEYAEWNEIIKELRERVRKRIDKLSSGTKKQEEQEFYLPIIEDFEAFKDAWRNHVMHARRTYGFARAEEVYTHVRRFMNRLASRVSEVGYDKA